MGLFADYQAKKKSSTIIAPIAETTVPEHIQHISSWWDHHGNLSSETRDKIQDATPGKSFTSFPLDTRAVDVDADVAEHLTKHNYEVKDYQKGIATIKKQVGNPEQGIPMREKYVDEKIGSVLDKTNASPDVKKAYMNDPARTATKGLIAGTHHVVIAHSPLAVSGMTTGTHWADTSCMNQEGGAYSHKLQNDSENGTHVAFLVHHDDEGAHKYGEPDKPIARIALKAFHEDPDDHESDTIFRPESKTYGTGTSAFSDAVGRWATKNYPAKAGVRYTKNSSLYDDDSKSAYVAHAPKDVEASIRAGDSPVEKKGDSMDKPVIDHAMRVVREMKNDPRVSPELASSAAMSMSEIGNLNTQHVAHLHTMAGDNKSEHQALAIAHGDKLPTSAFQKRSEMFFGHGLTNRMMMNPKLPSHVLDTLSPNDYTYVRRALLKPEHYQKVVDQYKRDESNSFYNLRDHIGHMNKSHLDSLTDGIRKGANASLIIKAPAFDQSHHDALVNSDLDAAALMSSSKFARLSDIGKLTPMNSKVDSLYSRLSNNPAIHPDDAKELARRFVDNAQIPSSNISGYNKYTVKDFGAKLIPESISKNFSSEDHAKLAASDKSLKFENGDHSEKHLLAHNSLVKTADKELDDHITDKELHHDSRRSEDDHEDYDETEDPVAKHLRNKLHDSVEKYANAIDNHIDKHVEDSDGEYITSEKHHDIARGHLSEIDGLEQYKTPENSNRWDDTEHHDDHVASIQDRLSDLRRNSDNRDDWD